MTLVSAQAPYQSVAAGSTAQAAGSALDNGLPKAFHTAVVSISNGTLTTGSVQLQLSNDGVNWWTSSASASPALAQNTVSTITANVVAQFVRANVNTAFTGGATVGVTVASA